MTCNALRFVLFGKRPKVPGQEFGRASGQLSPLRRPRTDCRIRPGTDDCGLTLLRCLNPERKCGSYSSLDQLDSDMAIAMRNLLEGLCMKGSKPETQKFLPVTKPGFDVPDCRIADDCRTHVIDYLQAEHIRTGPCLET